MIKYVNGNGKEIMLDKKAFMKLMKILYKRAKANKRQKVIDEMMKYYD